MEFSQTPSASRSGLIRRARLPLICQRAWPLGLDRVLLQDEAGYLAVWQLDQSAHEPVGKHRQPFQFRRAALSREGHVALGGWEGDVCWFHADGMQIGACGLAGPVGDLQWHGERLIVGAWNGPLVSAGWRGTKSLLNVAEGVRCIAVSSGEAFAALSMSGGASIYRGSDRKGQTSPIPDVIDIAYADNRLVVLTRRGLVTVAEDGAMSKPDKPPARGMLNLLSEPLTKRCLLVDDKGSSWEVDQRGTYPRGPRLPCGKSLITAAHGLTKFTASSPQGGFAYYRGHMAVLSWFEAVSASISYDGRRIIVLLPDALEIYEDAE